MLRILPVCLLTMVLSGNVVLAQKAEDPTSSATDPRVKIHEGKRVRATAPQDAATPRYKDKKKRAVNVSDRPSKVETTSKRKQKRNNKFRTGGK